MYFDGKYSQQYYEKHKLSKIVKERGRFLYDNGMLPKKVFVFQKICFKVTGTLMQIWKSVNNVVFIWK